jgi:hypothetical protein
MCNLLFCAACFAGDFSSELLLEPDELLESEELLLLEDESDEESSKRKI